MAAMARMASFRLTATVGYAVLTTYLRPATKLALHLRDETGAKVAARVSVTDDAGRFYAPEGAWIYADDGYDRSEQKFESHYFYCDGDGTVTLPEGAGVHVAAVSGYERALPKITVIQSGAVSEARVEFPAKWKFDDGDGQWVSADLHVHMNYGGEYKNTPAHLVTQARGEDLRVVNDLIVNKEQRFPDIRYSGKQLDPASTAETEVVHGQEFHTSYWGHRGVLDIREHILLPGYAGYPNTAAASLYPMNADVYDMGHAQGAMIGAVHPFDEMPDPFATPAPKLTDELPVDVALGKLDYMEIVGFSDHKTTAAVWYKLLNLGFRLPAGAGTDATANYAAPIRGQVGFDRVYLHLADGEGVTPEAWMAALKAGRTFATNGPLLRFTLGTKQPGDSLSFDAAQNSVAYHAELRSAAPVDHLEIVCNGEVAETLKLDETRMSADVNGTLPVNESGWCVLRAWSDKATYPVMDSYAYATTSPIYLSVGGAKAKSPSDANYFAAWIERAIETTSNYPDWNSAEEKDGVLRKLREARAIYEKLE